jgi:hypothetical protein
VPLTVRMLEVRRGRLVRATLEVPYHNDLEPGDTIILGEFVRGLTICGENRLRIRRVWRTRALATRDSWRFRLELWLWMAWRAIHPN